MLAMASPVDVTERSSNVMTVWECAEIIGKITRAKKANGSRHNLFFISNVFSPSPQKRSRKYQANPVNSGLFGVFRVSKPKRGRVMCPLSNELIAYPVH